MYSVVVLICYTILLLQLLRWSLQSHSSLEMHEATGMIEVRIRASGFLQQPYDVIVTPVEADPPDALGLLIYIHIYWICSFVLT